MNELTIRWVAPDHRDLSGLIGKLDGYLEQLYPPEEIFVIDFQDIGVEEILFAIAYLGNIAVGCGALRPINDRETELKRFYVEPAYRRNGIAGRLLAFLENEAQVSNYAAIRLETGGKLAEAVGFYRKHGYVESDKFGEYVGCPSSLCFEKRLA